MKVKTIAAVMKITKDSVAEERNGSFIVAVDEDKKRNDIPLSLLDNFQVKNDVIEKSEITLNNDTIRFCPFIEK